MRRVHHYHSPWKRGVYSLLFVTTIVTIGTVGLHSIERMPYLDAFYFMSMIATAQGPMSVPVTGAGKIFVALMAFISVGSVVGALGFFFGPFFGQLWHLGVKKLEEEAHLLGRHDKEK